MSIPNLSGVPVAIDASVSAAASAYTTSPTEANRLAYVQALNYQYSLNIAAVEADLQSLADQLDVARGVKAQLIELGQQTNQGANIGPSTVAAANAAIASEEAWVKTRATAIGAAVDSQVAGIVAAMP